jgi:serine/threonine-protein kinase
LKMSLDLSLLCQMLRDPEPAMHTKAKDLLIQLHDPQTAHVLAALLQDEAEDIRQRAAEVLQAVHDGTSIRILLEALRGQEWWVRGRAFDALRAAGDAPLFETVFTLLNDADEYLRSSAAEMVKKDHRAFEYVVALLAHTDSGVRARAVEALATLEDRRAVPIFLRMLRDTPEMGALIIRSLAQLGDRQALPALVQCVQGVNRELRIAALHALSSLTDAAHSEQVWQVVMAASETADDAECREAAHATANALVGKGMLVRPATPSILLPIQPVLSEPRGPGALTLCTPESHEHTMEAIIAEDEEASLYIDADRLAPGAMLMERYRVIRRVGKGGFGAVVLVEDVVIGEDIILKFLNRDIAADANMIERFKHELRYARRITHENVIRIHDFLTLQKSHAISMEYFPSHSLSDELKQGPLSLKRGLKIVWDICCGMRAAHQAGVVHRDLKPPNILLNAHGLVKVVDFGLAALNHTDARLTRTGVLIGTPTYMAPEQVRARTIDARTDIYSLGVIMYEIFTGRPPYVADDPMAVLFQHVEGKPTPPRQLKPEIPAAVEAIMLKAMWVDPARRFQSMDDLRKSILALSKQDVRVWQNV